MNNEILFHKKLNEKLFMKIGYEAEPYSFSYSNNGEIKKIVINQSQESEHKGEHIFLQDEEAIWEPDKYDLIIEKKIYINNPAFLFTENGIAAPDAVLGVALNWFSKSSNQRGTTKIGTITRAQINPFSAELKQKFEKNQLNGEVTLEIVIYLEKAPKFQAAWYSSQSGTTLGTLDTQLIILDGSGSTFPILEVSAPNMPLWFVTFNSTDLLTDPFTEEFVCINFNSAHKNFKYINDKKGDFSAPMLIEVLAGALHVIVQKTLDSPERENIINGMNLEDGSIGQAVYYFLKTFSWDISSPEKLAETIRKDLESRIEGD